MRPYFYLFISFLFFSCAASNSDSGRVVKVLKNEVLKRAAQNLNEEPVTVTSFIAERSMGGFMTFFLKVIIGGRIH